LIGIVEILFISFAAGVVGSILGLGGALIITPVLVYFGVPIKEAIAASMVAIIATSSGSASSYVKDGLSNIRAAFFLEIFTSVGAIVGAVVTSYVAPSYLYFFFAAFLASSFYGLRGGLRAGPPTSIRQDSLAKSLRLEGTYFDRSMGKESSYKLTRPLLAGPGMFVAGLAAGMLGIGGGAFKTAVQELVMGMPSKVATTTSNFIIGMTALAGASVYFTSGLINIGLAAPLAIGTTVGALAGARILPHISNTTARVLFLAVLSVLLVEMLYEGVVSL
jgi:uncharacterized membrane protein YfcA